MTGPDRWHRRLVGVLGDRATITTFERIVLALIVLNAAAVVLGTVEDLSARFGVAFHAVETATVGLFTFEYGLRAAKRLLDAGTPRARLRRLTEPYLVIDLLAILPAYVGLAIGVGGLQTASVLRILRLFKIARYVDAVALFARVVRRRRSDLIASVLGTTLLLVLAATGMYVVEHDAQPEAFSSIPATLWWAGVTISGVGYGDVVPVTPAGRVLGLVVALLGVGIAAVPASILVAGVLEETGETEAYDGCPQCGWSNE